MSGIHLYRPPDGFPHGTRARYVGARCRCDACRAANRNYQRSRAGQPFNGLVDAAPARAHLELLSSQGVGRRAVAAASDVSCSVVQDIRTGAKQRVRADTVRRLLAVDAGAIADHGLVPAKETRVALRELLRHGLTRQEIAERLGSTAKTPSLQLTKRHVTARNALKVKRLLDEVRAEVEAERRIGEICGDCGDSHSLERRLEWLRSQREIDREVIREQRPCWYAEGNESVLSRDLKRLARGDS
jgi:hypothetical protein